MAGVEPRMGSDTSALGSRVFVPAREAISDVSVSGDRRNLSCTTVDGGVLGSGGAALTERSLAESAKGALVPLPKSRAIRAIAVVSRLATDDESTTTLPVSCGIRGLCLAVTACCATTRARMESVIVGVRGS